MIGTKGGNRGWKGRQPRSAYYDVSRTTVLLPHRFLSIGTERGTSAGGGGGGEGEGTLARTFIQKKKKKIQLRGLYI